MARLPYPNSPAAEATPLNVMKLLSLSAGTSKHWSSIGGAQFSGKLALSAPERELAILLTTAKFGSTYEHTHHVAVSAKVGITDQQRAEVAQAGGQKGYFASDATRNTKCFSPRETTLLRFVEAVIEGPEVQQALWEETRAAFSDREIVELITLQVSSMRERSLLEMPSTN